MSNQITSKLARIQDHELLRELLTRAQTRLNEPISSTADERIRDCLYDAGKHLIKRNPVLTPEQAVMAQMTKEQEAREIATSLGWVPPSKVEKAIEDTDDEWIDAIATCHVRMLNKPWDVLDGESRLDGVGANIAALFQIIEDSANNIKALREVLRKHHTHSLEDCNVFFEQDGKPIEICTDLANAYSESSLFDETVRVLSTIPVALEGFGMHHIQHLKPMC